jgi:hypothetical protein
MNHDVMPPAVSVWATRNLPARLDVAATAKLLGFAEHDIQILMNTGKLVPLGDPAPNAPKWFSAVAVFRLAIDEDWLHKATRDLTKYWKHKRERVGRKRGRRMTPVVAAMVPSGANTRASLN